MLCKYAYSKIFNEFIEIFLRYKCIYNSANTLDLREKNIPSSSQISIENIVSISMFASIGAIRFPHFHGNITLKCVPTIESFKAIRQKLYILYRLLGMVVGKITHFLYVWNIYFTVCCKRIAFFININGNFNFERNICFVTLRFRIKLMDVDLIG